MTLTDNGEPTSEDGDNNTNLTVDFGFIAGGGAGPASRGTTTATRRTSRPAPPRGTTTPRRSTTAPPTSSGCPTPPTSAPASMPTAASTRTPRASGDDLATSDLAIGTCEERRRRRGRRLLHRPVRPRGARRPSRVTAGGPSACVLNAWVDWNGDGIFGDSAGEQIATDTHRLRRRPLRALAGRAGGRDPGPDLRPLPLLLGDRPRPHGHRRQRRGRGLPGRASSAATSATPRRATARRARAPRATPSIR